MVARAWGYIGCPAKLSDKVSNVMLVLMACHKLVKLTMGLASFSGDAGVNKASPVISNFTVVNVREKKVRRAGNKFPLQIPKSACVERKENRGHEIFQLPEPSINTHNAVIVAVQGLTFLTLQHVLKSR
ncbi:hypothetical protein D3C85_1312840 [compost metagenome]